MKLKTKQLESCFSVLSTYDWRRYKDDPTENSEEFLKLMHAVLHPKYDLAEFYLQPFTKELKRNLFLTESKEGKEGIIRYYIWELRELGFLFKRECSYFDDLEGEWDEILYRKYLKKCHVLFSDIFEELQYACFKYEIDFDGIVRKMLFPIDNVYYIMDLLRGTTENSPSTFKDIFSKGEWQPYIDILYKIEPPLIDKNYNFIGKSKGHVGVIGSWIKELQIKGIIYSKYNRQTLAEVLNNEIKGLNMGKDGKTLTNLCSLYEDDIKGKLLKLLSLVP